MFEVAMMKQTLNAPLTKLLIPMLSPDSLTWLFGARSASEFQLAQGGGQGNEHNPPDTKTKRHPGEGRSVRAAGEI